MKISPDALLRLNDEQKQAVTHVAGPLLIIAGAGTGKTTAIVEKIKYIIANKLAKPDEILALTFTEKASLEMEERVDKEMPYGYFQMWISTFHAFADQILRDEISHIGLNPGYKLLTQAETVLFLKNNLFLFNLKYFRPLGNPHKFLVALLQHFSRLRDEDVSPEQYLKWAHGEHEEKEKIMELARAYETYQAIKTKEGFFDFADLNHYLLELFRERPVILQKYRKQFKYILVDEFQDTNTAQYLMLKLVCPVKDNPNLTVVGDDSQAIYKFRGASISNILTFMKDYPEAKQITLKVNYRSYQDILDVSHKLVQNNNPDTLESQLGISKKLSAQRGNKKDLVNFSLAENGEDEAEFVSREILALKQKNNYKYSDFAILVRANNHANAFVSALMRSGIPYRFLGPGMLFKQPEVKDLISYLKVLYNIEDSVSLYRVLSMNIFNINQKDIILLLAFSRKTNLSLFQAIEVYLAFLNTELYRPEFEIYKRFLPLIHEETKSAVAKIYTMINRHLALVKKDSAGQILYFFLEDTGYLKLFTSYKTEKDEKIVLNINKLFTKLKTFENEHEDASVFAVVDYIDMSMELGESPVAAETDAVTYDAVNIMTVHSAKGLEFPVVFLVNLTKGRFPTTEKKEPIPIPEDFIKEILPQGNYHEQEERRLFYVGLTRAKNKVYLSASKFYGEGKKERKLSPFIYETIGEDAVIKQETKKSDEKAQLSIFEFKKQEETLVREKLPIVNFSYSQLESFALCPLQYKYQYLLKIPTSPSSALSFGDTIHRTLQAFYQEYMKNHSVNLPTLIEIYKQNWMPVGYTSSSHQERMKKEGEKMLTKYFTTFHSTNIKIVDLEKLFKIRISPDTFVTGKIDRIDQNGDGAFEIIDYKTGSKPDDKYLQKSLQLSIYALAATDKGLYNKKLSDVTLTFFYLQDMQKISMKRTDEEMEMVKENIIKAAEEIKQDRFLPKIGPWCNFCSFRMICEAWQ